MWPNRARPTLLTTASRVDPAFGDDRIERRRGGGPIGEVDGHELAGKIRRCAAREPDRLEAVGSQAVDHRTADPL